MAARVLGVGERRLKAARTPTQEVLAGQQAEQGQRSEDDGLASPRWVSNCV